MKFNTKLNIQYSEYWDGREIRIRSNGRVPLCICKDRASLTLHTSKGVYQKIKASGKIPTITFSEQGVALTVGKEVVFSRSGEKLLKTKEAKDWGKQIEKELQNKRR